MFTAASLDSVAHVIQVALTPVFLLSGIATLLNVFSTRLGRVADRVDLLTQRLEGNAPGDTKHLSAQLAYLRRRSLWLDTAVVLAAIAGVLTCASAVLLFLGALRDRAGGTILYLDFGLAIIFTIGALLCFLTEMLITGRGLREEVSVKQTQARAAERA